MEICDRARVRLRAGPRLAFGQSVREPEGINPHSLELAWVHCEQGQERPAAGVPDFAVFVPIGDAGEEDCEVLLNCAHLLSPTDPMRKL